MKTIPLIMVAVALCGCVNVAGTRTAPDGSKLTIRATRVLWVSQDLSFSTKTEDGTTVTLKAANSRSDVEAVQALGEIAKSAIVK